MSALSSRTAALRGGVLPSRQWRPRDQGGTWATVRRILSASDRSIQDKACRLSDLREEWERARSGQEECDRPWFVGAFGALSLVSWVHYTWRTRNNLVTG